MASLPARGLRALVTNDDGIDSLGLWVLAGAARDAGFDVVVAAPHVDASGTGGSVLAVRADGRVRLHRHPHPDLPGVPGFAVEGHPAFIVHSAGRGWLDPPPDVVLSGINLGPNVGRAVLHSGTVGAALTASLHDWRGLAVSLATPVDPPEAPHWATAAALVPDVLALLLAAPARTVYSLNSPDLPLAEIGPLQEARLADFGSVQIRVDQQATGDGDALHSHQHELSEPPEPGTDTALLAAGHPTLTELTPVGERAGVLSEARAG